MNVVCANSLSADLMSCSAMIVPAEALTLILDELSAVEAGP
jgi:hypothetical protein